MIWLNSSSDSLFEIFSIKDISDDLLLWLYILPIWTYTSKSCSSSLILINLQSRCSFIVFSLSNSLRLSLSLCPSSSTSIANLCLGIYKSILWFKTEWCSNIFSLQITFVIFVNNDCYFIIIKSFQSYPNLVINSIAAGVLQSIIIDKVRSS